MDENSFEDYVRRCWDVFDMDNLLEAYRMTVLSAYAIGDQIAQRERVILRNEEDFGDRDSQDTPPFTPESYFPRCIITTHTLNGERIYQLSYDGMLPLYFDKDRQRKYQDEVRDHYVGATMNAIRSENNKLVPFQSAFMYICHFFSDLTIRDLDNRNRSHLINAARHAGLIAGDQWEKLEIMESGYLDAGKKNHVSVFISSRENGLKMVEYVKGLCRNGHRFRVEMDTKKRLF